MFLKYKFLVQEIYSEITLDIIPTKRVISIPIYDICDCGYIYLKPISINPGEGFFYVPEVDIGSKTYKKPDKESLLSVIVSDLSISTDMDLYHTISSVINKYVSTNNGHKIKCSSSRNSNKDQVIITPEKLEHRYTVNNKFHLVNVIKRIIFDYINSDSGRLKEVSARDFMGDWRNALVTIEDIITPAIALLPEIAEPNLNRIMDNKMFNLCSKILFTILPEAKRIKRGDHDKIWKMHIYATPDVYKGTIFVYTHAPNELPRVRDRRFELTVKQAEILAVYILEKLNKLEDTPILTPLADALFSINDLQDMLRIYNENNNSQDTYINNINEFASMLNSSCQPGGALLANSNATIACIAVFAATKGMESLTHRTDLYFKAYELYARADPCIKLFYSLWPYAAGETPLGFSIEEVLEKVSKQKPAKISALAAMRQAMSYEKKLTMRQAISYEKKLTFNGIIHGKKSRHPLNATKKTNEHIDGLNRSRIFFKSSQ